MESIALSVVAAFLFDFVGERVALEVSLVHEDGTEEKFQRAHWLTKLQDEKFKKRVLQIMDDDVIMKFSNKTGKASDFYDHEEILPQTDE